MKKCSCCGNTREEESMTLVVFSDGQERFYCSACADGMVEVLRMENLENEMEVYYPQE